MPGTKPAPPTFQYDIDPQGDGRLQRVAEGAVIIGLGRPGMSVMEDKERERLQHQAELAARIAEVVKDESTAQRLKSFAHEVGQKLVRLMRRSKVRARAYELWEVAGRPPDRDLEFWLEAERQVREEHLE